MVFFVAGFALLLQVIFWGLGLAILATPARWRRHWPVFVPAFGLALQSLLVWIPATWFDLPGTLSYAWWTLLVPAGLLGWALRRRRWDVVLTEARRYGGVYLLAAGILIVALVPASSASKTLTSMSLGSCDAADYAAGARLLMEFSRSDRAGFLGLTEVVQLHSVDNFFDHFVRLNHFTPSALLALNNAIHGWSFYQTVSLLGAVLVAASVPMVFWVSRTLFRLGPSAAGWVALIYGINPVTLYSVWHVALGQTLAALAIALLTWAVVDLWRQLAVPSRGRAANFAVIAAAFALILGSYHFILLVCLVPAAGFVGGMVVWYRQWRRLRPFLLWTALPLVVAGVLYAERVAGLVERFLLFQQYDFGWKIPYLLPDGWLGLVGDLHLQRLSTGLSIVLASAILLLIAWSVIRGLKSGRSWNAYMVICAVVPIAAGYVFLQVRGARLGTNASYDAYKLLAVFHPLILGALCCWLTRPMLASLRWKIVAAVAIGVITAGNLRVAYTSAIRMESPPLMVDADLIQVQEVEKDPRVTSVNMRIADFWTRLWSNAFLLRKPQYFLEYTYEGRRNTEPKGEWDLLGGLIQVRTPDRGDSRSIGPRFSLLRVASSTYIQASIGEGWFERESAPRMIPWRWTQGAATIVVENPQDRTLRGGFALRARGLIPSDVQLYRNGEFVRRFHLGSELQTISVPGVDIVPGRNVFELRPGFPPRRPGPGDSRLLGLMVQGIDFNLTPDPPEGN